jgi:hypothetical protein
VYRDQRFGPHMMLRSRNSTQDRSGAQNAGAASGCSSSGAMQEPNQLRHMQIALGW